MQDSTIPGSTPDMGTPTKPKQAEMAASKESVMQAYEKMLEAKDHFRLAAEAAGMDLKHDAVEQLDKGRAKAQELGDQASQYVHEKPLATLGIAFFAGLVFAQLLSRR